MTIAPAGRVRAFVDLTHVGRHVTGIERVAIEQFERAPLDNVDIVPVRAASVLSMVLKQQFLLPALAAMNRRAVFVFPGFPPSPLFALCRRRVLLYVHDLFLLTRRGDLGRKAAIYMAPQFAFALRHLSRFFANSETTARELRTTVGEEPAIVLYRPTVRNHFALDPAERAIKSESVAPLRLVSLGTVEPRKNYEAAVAILDVLRARHGGSVELHIIGRPGWGDSARAVNGRTGVIVHGYLDAGAVKRIIDEADVYLCTSHDEGLGLPLLEAQYAGLPIVAPDKAVFREVLGSSGTFIDTSDAEGSATEISALVASPDWRRRSAADALANVQRWNAAAESDIASAAKALTYTAAARGAEVLSTRCV